MLCLPHWVVVGSGVWSGGHIAFGCVKQVFCVLPLPAQKVTKGGETMQSKPLPFGLLYRDETPVTERGYGQYPSIIGYDPISQIVTFSSRMGGETQPTTRSQIESTGIFDRDADEANDDKGTD